MCIRGLEIEAQMAGCQSLNIVIIFIHLSDYICITEYSDRIYCTLVSIIISIH